MKSRFIVCEKSGQWAAALRWAQREAPLRIYEVRSLIDCRNELRVSPASVVALETQLSNLEGVFRLLLEIRNGFSQAQVILLASRAVHRWENMLREAGAWHVLYSPRYCDRVMRQAEKRIAAMSQSHLALRDIIWSRLPWGE